MQEAYHNPNDDEQHRRRKLRELTKYACALYVSGDISSVGSVLASLTRVQESAGE